MDTQEVSICVWRAVIDRLPTRVNLLRRGVLLASLSCPICGNVEETIEHCIILCPRILRVSRKIWGWWNLDLPAISLRFPLVIWLLGPSFLTVALELIKFFMASFVARLGVFGIGETKLSTQIKIMLLESSRNACSQLFKGSQRLGSRLVLSRLMLIRTDGFSALLTFWLVHNF